MPKPDLRASGANIAQAIQEAAAHYREGRFAEAERLCSRVLKAHPGQFDWAAVSTVFSVARFHGHAVVNLPTDRGSIQS